MKYRKTKISKMVLTYIDEGCVHIICVFFSPFDWNDDSVELIWNRQRDTPVGN